ncbi:MAG: ABC transporter ATP-binding protein [Deltaproteobacteria bacterium]|nr:MAG: ABC transporter ATP-binding protein [Deltaproteobacteria bacterium]
MLELSHITFTYPGAAGPTLEDLSFKVLEPRTGIIGPNGCGKTTLLHIMVGLLKPEKGQILYKEMPVQTKQDFSKLRREVGFVFQSSNDQLFCPTVIEDVAFGPLNLGYPPEAAVEQARATLKTLGLDGFEDKITHKLSGGEKKLVALATVLAMRPRILLLDEPTNNLDPRTTKRLREILRQLEIQQVIISHDWDFLSHTADDFYLVSQRRMQRCEKDHIHEHRHIHKAGDHPHVHRMENP